MERSHQVTFLPFEMTMSVGHGMNLLEAARRAGLPVKSSCGEKGTCGDCLVRVTGGKTKTRKTALVSEDLSGQGYVLACQSVVLSDLVVELPQFEETSIRAVVESRFFREPKERISGVVEIDPLVKRISLELPAPSLEDNVGDLRRIQRELEKNLGVGDAGCEYSALKKIAAAVREDKGKISLRLFDPGKTPTVIDIRPGIRTTPVFGLACDIGTTTVALDLVDLETGEIVAQDSSFNRQLKCGEDVISRIHYARTPEKLVELQGLVVATVNALIDKACQQSGTDPSDIFLASIAGNTTMTHLFLGLDPRYIREEPYIPTVNQVPFVPARNLGLHMNPEGRIDCAPAVGSYVGGDITAGLLITPILHGAENASLFIDAGTNGELVVGNGDWLITCACSAGPAFEGGGTKCGMPASDGAIDKLKLTGRGDVEYSVIGGGKPKGLCGSGIVDILAELFIHGFIDRQGQFRQDKAGGRLVGDVRDRGFVIESAGRSAWGKDIVITERDIANLIRTKAAVYSACSLLLKNVGLDRNEMAAVFVAGGFGENLNIENAIRIGLLPDIDRTKFHYLGNSSLAGAYLRLLSKRNRELVDSLAKKMTYIELMTEPAYMNEYMGSLFLPHTRIDLFPSVKELIHNENGERRQ
jgi:uncharacterized 2Fe-2S/4Fe-4S cluster protein (DUF4445 family)